MEEGGKQTSEKNWITNQIQFVFEPIKDWHINVEGSLRQYNEKYHWAVLPIYGYDTDNNPYPLSWNGGAAGYSEVQDYRASEDYFSTNIFSDYSKTIGDHYFKVMAGFNAELYKKGGLTGFGTDLITPSVPELNTTQDNKNAYNSASELAIAGFFGRINYNFDNRYLIQATMRYDGSSKFGKNNRWGCFPSIALGWRISEEKFFPKNTFINNLKFRVSWGRLGNENALGYYDFQALISSYNTYYGGYVQGSGSNPWAGAVAWNMERNDLKWETTDTKNIGFDYAMFNNRLTGSINYYINQTEDLLITKKLSPSAGYQNPILNVGKIRNRGFELELNWNDRIKDFEYGIGFNLSTTHNEVISLADKGQALYCTGLVYGTDYTPAYATEGKPISAFYLYRTDGIFQSDAEAAAYVNANGERLQPNAKAGDIRFKDINGDGVLDENDREYCGTGIPKVEANLNLTAGYKGFDLSLLFGSAWGHKLFNGNRYFYESMQTPGQMLTSVLDAWTPTNTDTDMPRAVLNDPNRNARESDRFLENGTLSACVRLSSDIPCRQIS